MTQTRLAADAPTFEMPAHKRLEYVPGQYFVRVHPEAVRPHLRIRTQAGAADTLALTAATAESIPQEVVEPLDFLHDNVGLRNVRALSGEHIRTQVRRAHVSGRQRDRLGVAASVVGWDSAEEDELAGIAIAELDPNAGMATIRRAESAPAIDFIEPVPAHWLVGAQAADPHHNLQWGLRAVRWFDARRPDASSVSVGIVDTGIDTGHPDLAGVDVEDYHHVSTRAEDIVGHGTHVAGIIAATTNDSVGIAGVATCPLNIWKVFSDKPHKDGEYYVDDNRYYDALRDAANAGLRVLNISLGGIGSARTEQRFIDRLVKNGVLVVAAMGNEFARGNPTEYPAAYDGVLAVGAIAETRERSSFSNTGVHIGICAPGSNILSTLPRDDSSYREDRMYAAWSGTSMATPHVAAAAALVAAQDQRLGPAEIQDRLCKTAAKLPAMEGRHRTYEYGSGLLDLEAALS
jgi:Subtilase family